MTDNDIDTFIDTIRIFGRDRKYIVRFGCSSILITVYLNEISDILIGETWSDGQGIKVKTFNDFKVNLFDIN